MNETIFTLIVNAIVTPILVLMTMWFHRNTNSGERREKRDDGFIDDMKKRIDTMEREIKALRVEMKLKDEQYLKLFTEHTTLKVQYEVLSLDHAQLSTAHEDLKTQYEHTVAELKKLGTKTT